MAINFKDWQKNLQEEQLDETPVTKAKQPYRPGSIDPATGKTREAPKGTYAYDKAQREKNKVKEELTGNQHKLDVDKDGKIERSDLKKLRAKKDEIVVNKGEQVRENDNCGKKMYREFVEEIEQIVEAKVEPSEPNADAIAKRKAREAAQRRREEKAEADKDDLSKDYKHSSAPKAHTTKVAGKAYGGAAQHDDEEDETDKPSAPAVKRGRGRPAGAKSGARTAGNGKQYGGLTMHSLNLPSKK